MSSMYGEKEMLAAEEKRIAEERGIPTTSEGSGITAGTTVAATAGGMTAWGMGMTAGMVIGLVTGALLALALPKWLRSA